MGQHHRGSANAHGGPATERRSIRRPEEYSVAHRLSSVDGYSVRDLAHAANDHLLSAFALFDANHYQMIDSAGYLSHLAIELILKAALLDAVQSFPKEHGLEILRAELSSTGVSLNLSTASEAMFERLDSFYSLRYPDPAGLPPLGNPDRQRIHALFRELVDSLPVVMQAIDAIDHTRKAGRILMKFPDPDAPAS